MKWGSIYAMIRYACPVHTNVPKTDQTAMQDCTFVVWEKYMTHSDTAMFKMVQITIHGDSGPLFVQCIVYAMCMIPLMSLHCTGGTRRV